MHKYSFILTMIIDMHMHSHARDKPLSSFKQSFSAFQHRLSSQQVATATRLWMFKTEPPPKHDAIDVHMTEQTHFLCAFTRTHTVPAVLHCGAVGRVDLVPV